MPARATTRPSDFETETLLAEARFDVGDNLDEVEKRLRNIINRHPDFAFARVVLADVLFYQGKTRTAVNLALAMAKTGGRVLLVDADLRNPSVARMMHLVGDVGLTTVLLGQASADDVVQRWGDSNLYVMAAGQIPPNPTELLGSEPMQALFSELSQHYDFILVDSSPLVPVIDAVLLDKLTGGMLMVVASSRTKKRDLAHAPTVERIARDGCVQGSHALDRVD